MSVTRKPSYDLHSLIDRVTWFPVLHDVLTRMWFVVFAGVIALFGLIPRWRRVRPPERLLALWIGVGTFELLLHDVGNERRFLIFIPALIAVASLALGRDRTLLPAEISTISRGRALWALPVVLYALYVVTAPLVRLSHLYEIGPNVRLAAAIAALVSLIALRDLAVAAETARAGQLEPGGRAADRRARLRRASRAIRAVGGRTFVQELRASIMLGQVLAPGTLVHGKLANGLSLENRIKPVFVGRQFGNYEDRRRRDDVRYILTYVAPSLGYESQARNPVIQDVLDAYPNHRILMTFDVAETTTGHDRAALIDKFGSAAAGASNGTGRAHD